MSYNLFLLLNPNHEKETLLGYIANRLETAGSERFCLDQSPDLFFSVEYLREGMDSSLCIDIPFGAEELVVKEVLDFMTYLQETIQFQVLDPQIGKITEPGDTNQILDSWKKTNREALQSYQDGHYFLRNLEEREGRKEMIEATRFKEETWQNHCSVAMAYNRIQDADQALKHFERAMELDPENPGIWHAIGVTLFNLRRYKEANEILSRYLQVDPENETARELSQICQSKVGAGL